MPLAEKEQARCVLFKHTLAFIAVFVLLLYKSPDALTHPQFWAEDGTIFFQQQFGHLAPPIFASYNGYLHVIPRLVAWVAEAFRYKDAPFIYNLSAITIGAASIFYFAEKSKFLTPFWITVAIFVLVPTNGEEFGDLTNAQWLMQLPLFALALYPRSSGITSSAKTQKFVTRCLCYAVITCLSLTGPFSIFCALIGSVLFALSYIHERYGIRSSLTKLSSDWWLKLDKSVFLLIALGGIVQVITLLFFGNRPTGAFSFHFAKAMLTTGLQIHVLGAELLPRGLFLLTVVMALVAATQYCRKQLNTAHMVMLAMGVFAVIQILGAPTPFFDEAAHSINGDRYFFFAKVAFWVSVAAMLQTDLPEHKMHRTLLVPITLIFIHLCNPSTLQRPPLADLDWKKAARQLNSQDKVVRIPINPTPWFVTITRP